MQGAGHGAGCRVQGAGCRVQGAGCRVQGAGCRLQGAGHRAQGAGSGVWVCDEKEWVRKSSDPAGRPRQTLQSRPALGTERAVCEQQTLNAREGGGAPGPCPSVQEPPSTAVPTWCCAWQVRGPRWELRERERAQAQGQPRGHGRGRPGKHPAHHERNTSAFPSTAAPGLGCGGYGVGYRVRGVGCGS